MRTTKDKAISPQQMKALHATFHRIVLKDAEASENDLRRVKRCVHSRKRIMDARARKGEAE